VYPSYNLTIHKSHECGMVFISKYFTDILTVSSILSEYPNCFESVVMKIASLSVTERICIFRPGGVMRTIYVLFNLLNPHSGTLLRNYNFVDYVSLFYFINHIQAFNHLTKTGMFPVKMFRICAAVADKKLGASCIEPRVCHT